MIPGYKVAKVCYAPRSENIIHHKRHSYDEKNRVIVIDDMDEDRQEFINSFADSVGLKNIMRQLQLQGGVIPLQMAYDPDKDAVDTTGFDGIDNINDLKKAADEGDKVIKDAVTEFNKTYGTNYSVEEFIKKSADGSLLTEMSEALKNKDDAKEEGEK